MEGLQAVIKGRKGSPKAPGVGWLIHTLGGGVSIVATIALDILPMLEQEAKEGQATSTGGAVPQLGQFFD